MLACRAGEIKLPCYISPKLDGVRAVIFGGVVYSRSLKPIPNKWVQKMFGLHNLEGFDGELICGDPTAKDVYRKTNSAVMSEEGEPDVSLWVFDCCRSEFLPHDFASRDGWVFITTAIDSTLSGRVVKVPQTYCESSTRLDQLCELNLKLGYEGSMVRSPTSPYKFGRSTEKEGYLMKIKKFEDSEAVVIGMTELLHNDNPATTSELGLTKRSSHKDNKTPAGVMGSLLVKDLNTDVEFEIGTGFTSDDREEFWKDKGDVIGRIVKYKHFPNGVKDKPRFPVFLGFRHKEDL